jgi:hypothetical protein
VVDETLCHFQQAVIADRAMRADSRLDEVAETVQLMPLREVAPWTAVLSSQVRGVEVAIILLSPLDQVDRLLEEGAEIEVVLPAHLPGRGLQGLVDVGVSEQHPAEIGIGFAGEPAEVLEVAVLLEHGDAVWQGHSTIALVPVVQESCLDQRHGEKRLPHAVTSSSDGSMVDRGSGSHEIASLSRCTRNGNSCR